MTDIVDGAIARAWKATSDLGGKLDSLGDFTLVAAALVALAPVVNPPLFIGVWVAAIALARLCSPVVAFCRHRTLGMIHTWGNKATGLLLFLYPFTLVAGVSEEALIALCTLASVTAAEELAIQLTSARYDGDRASLFSKDALR